MDTRRQIVRGFLELHFTENPEVILARPLKRLGGKSLSELISFDWKMVQAWVQEYRLHPDEKLLLIESSLPPATIKIATRKERST
jgi:hypothetical protein